MSSATLRPEDVSKEDSKRVLDFLNAAKTAKEISMRVEFPKERDVGLKVAQNILDTRAKIGAYTSLTQILEVPQVGPERFTEIVTAVLEKSARETFEDAFLGVLPSNLRESLHKLREYDGKVSKKLNADPKFAERFLKDPAGALIEMGIPVDPELRKHAKVGGLDDFLKPRKICLPNGRTITPRIKVRFVSAKEETKSARR
ncbi:MAG TPA: hypothetical protein VIH03_03765 [Nitrososphaerales archaeon]